MRIDIWLYDPHGAWSFDPVSTPFGLTSVIQVQPRFIRVVDQIDGDYAHTDYYGVRSTFNL